MPTFNYTGVKPSSGNFELIPEGWYPWRIIEAEEGESSNHEYQVKVFIECADGKNETNITHYLTFKAPEAKGAGMALHFLKCIGAPFEGEFDVEPTKWIGKKFMGKNKHDEYNGQKRNKLSAISPMREDVDPNFKEELAKAKKANDIPF
jgi:hypothetical protein